MLSWSEETPETLLIVKTQLRCEVSEYFSCFSSSKQNVWTNQFDCVCVYLKGYLV